jgi:ATP-dependent Clp protease ATP-binding subunit ClpA
VRLTVLNRPFRYATQLPTALFQSSTAFAFVSYGCVVLENFSVGAQRVVSLATMEARRLDHPRVGTEHLLLGVLSNDDGEPADVLRAAGVSLAAARHKVVEALGADAGLSNSEALPFTPRAQRALERAGRFSRKEQEPEVTAGYVLLGVLDVEGLACQVLRGLGVDIDHVRDALVASRVHMPVVPVDDQPSVEEVRPRCPNCHALLDDTLSETLISARRHAEPTTDVSVAYCGACGATLGVVRPESSIDSQPPR